MNLVKVKETKLIHRNLLHFYTLTTNHQKEKLITQSIYNHIKKKSVQLLSHVQLFATPWTTDARSPCPSPAPRVYPNSCPLSQWCHPTISSSVIPFSSCPLFFPASGSFQMSQLFTSGGQSIGVSASTSDLPMNTQDWMDTKTRPLYILSTRDPTSKQGTHTDWKWRAETKSQV